MAGEAERAAAYERRYPDTGISEAQAAEREDRLRHAERAGHRRVFTMPAVPWAKEKKA